MAEGPQIVWFKRDLRVHDHAPLARAAQTGAPVIPLYIIEPQHWAEPFASRRHWHFIHECLSELSADLQTLGQPLVLRRGDACEVLNALRTETGATTLWAHEETADMWTFERDKRVRAMCRQTGLTMRELPSGGVVRRLHSRDDWSEIRNTRMGAALIPKPTALTPAPVRGEALRAKDDPLFGAPLCGTTQRGGRRAAIEDLRSFLETRASGYLRHISSPARSEQSCSRLSAHLAWGSLSAREVVQALERRRADLSPVEKKTLGRNLSAFGSRLAWRCHFIQKLEDEPELETTCMHPAFEGLREGEYRDDHFEAWATGRTGYPFVDACMRSLIHTGWITFRMRAMLVSFASYQLWLDWRVTAPCLARLFTDYEPGIHYSQFQMQSGVTGINAIRVYNPIKQGLDQDPEGAFMRRWLPELRGVATDHLHAPGRDTGSLFEGQNGAGAYPTPIVDTQKASRRAKDRIAEVRKSELFKAGKQAVYQKHGSRKRPAHRKAKPATSPDQLDLFG